MIQTNAFSILVGGDGTRVSKITKGKAKSELKIINGKSILEYQVNYIRKKKFNNKIFINSNKSFISLNKSVSRIKNISVILENKKLGTAGAIKLLEKYKYNNFIIIFGDILFNFNFKKFINFHNQNKSDLTLVVHPNNHPSDSDCVIIDNSGKVKKFYNKPKKFKTNLCSSGIFIFKREVLALIPKNKKKDISEFLIKKLLKKKKRVFAYHTREYLKDIGTPKRFKQAKKDIISSKYKNGIIDKKIPAIFIDRDGVINFDNYIDGYQNPNKIINGFYKAIKIINQKGYLCILVTNQPAVAKGFITLTKLKEDLLKLEEKMARHNTFFDKIYFCPCHPEKGYRGEVKKFKRNCSWRKPNNGMFEDAIKRFNIDRKKSFMIGDRLTDYLASKKSSLKFIQVGNFIKQKKLNKKSSLISATKYIFKN